MRMQKHDLTKTNEQPRLDCTYIHSLTGGTGGSTLQAVGKDFHCQSPQFSTEPTDRATERKGQGLSGRRRGQ